MSGSTRRTPPPLASRASPSRWAYVAALLPSLVLLGFAARRILERAGEPAFPLDDSFIHLQFASRLAKGHPFEYTPGGGYSSGATSFLWPIGFVPFFWAGLDGVELVPVAWLFGALLHAGVAYETWRLARGLFGSSGAVTALAAGAMCTAFGAFAWFALSGMETLLFTWALVRTARVAAEHAERPYEARGSSTLELGVLALAAPLARPEGALATALALVTLGRDLRLRPLRRRAALAMVLGALGPCLVPIAHRLGTGHSASSTAMVKHLAFDPYLDTTGVIAATRANAERLVTDLLNGGPWTVEFLPEGFAWLLAGGLVALPVLATRRDVRWRAAMVLAVALGTLGPTTYATLLWNRVRYIWPFAPGWFLLSCTLFVEAGHRLGKRFAPLGLVAPAAAWGLAATLAMKLDWATADLATSARAITKQQVTLGRWAREHLPDDALIGVNDTGAIAYFSGRKTFDLVGLTTEGEAPYWALGAGARFEHWERRHEAGLPLPTHLFVYRSWMGLTPLEGPTLTEATVVDQSILGGRTMTAMEADYALLGSGKLPFASVPGAPLGELDVADAESERSHAFALGDAQSGWCVATLGFAPNGDALADGGRLERAEDHFTLGTSAPVRLVLRVDGGGPLEVWADGVRVGEASLLAAGEGFRELAVDLPKGARDVAVRPTRPKRFASYHYWWYGLTESTR